MYATITVVAIAPVSGGVLHHPGGYAPPASSFHSTTHSHLPLTPQTNSPLLLPAQTAPSWPSPQTLTPLASPSPVPTSRGKSPVKTAPGEKGRDGGGNCAVRSIGMANFTQFSSRLITPSLVPSQRPSLHPAPETPSPRIPLSSLTVVFSGREGSGGAGRSLGDGWGG